ncbi:DUF1674 domain-containing protein [Candidatus Liberibacter asiaticus]|nr:DUF1674 domain-containing protein [Candidatus Liberibacter asiaticus]AGH16645.1 hypothetical protein WSI_01375 [Candidatus Liberibacter asiaticus str. gxpsy]ALK07032.1 DUF1674 domain-containing protein [Candidatus Liberibacter asiaticus]ASK52502.1 DUF1674 domain-containing protein [Candidatus Liberibacter asiaticus]AWL13826.1 DUF1674 domain-containing protein [Candidatus Liberibacter asiaticus]KAE9510374.1 hypothetical protein FXW22_01385 [Candidatus Liberibacter asiaticus]
MNNSTIKTSHDPLSSIAKRALEEAKQRKSANNKDAKLPIEIGGRKGLDPTRFGDWEKNGISIDF